jgi:hypothetical protein
MADPDARDTPLPLRLTRLMTSLWVPQAIYVAAELRLADALAGGPARSCELAERVGADEGALHRLLRALAALDLCAEHGDGTFSLTPLGACLRGDSPDSVRSWTLLMGGQGVWQAWGRLLDGVRTGRSVRQPPPGEGPFDAVAADPARLEVLYRSMVELTRPLARWLAGAYDFSDVRLVVDVGGGYGALLPPILAAFPGATGLVLDLPHCRDGALRLLGEAGVLERCAFVGGSFLDSVPPGGDLYVLKSVVHDWDDERGLTILRNCRAAMPEGSRLLLIEVVMPERMGPSPADAGAAVADLNMLVLTGGRERTGAEYRGLLERAGLRLERVLPTPSALSVMEARPA